MNTVKIYDFTLAANGMQELSVDGDYFRVMSATGAINVRLDNGNVIGPLQPGQGFRNSTYHRLIIQDATGAVNKGTVICANSDFVDDRITGEVSIIDGAKARTKNGTSFLVPSACAAVASTYSHCQIFNPNTSTKNGIIEQLIISAAADCSVLIGINNTQLTNVYNGALSKSIYPPFVSSIFGAWQTNAGQLMTNVYANVFVKASTPFVYKLTAPILLPPIGGLCVVPNTQNIALNLTAEYYEEPI